MFGQHCCISTSIIPKVPESAPVYTTADRAYQFAYVQSGNEYIAILLGFNKSTILENQTLTIPGEVDAYKQYNTNEGTDKGYVAVGRSGNFLFYDNITTSVTTETKKEVVNGVADTEVVYTTTTEHHQLYPCGTRYRFRLGRAWKRKNLLSVRYLILPDTGGFV